MKKPILLLASFALATSFLSFSCKNGSGPGGKASIEGVIKATRWVNTCTTNAGTFMAADEDVYIIYGEDPSYGDRIKTGPDGTYEFKYLRPGKYTVYAYSTNCSVAQKQAVSMEVEITEKGQALIADTLRIDK